MKGKRGKHSGADFNSTCGTEVERRKRFCIDCGVRHGRYPPGVSFAFGGKSMGSDDNHELWGGYGIVCQRCGKFKRVRDDRVGFRGRTCWACLAGVMGA